MLSFIAWPTPLWTPIFDSFNPHSIILLTPIIALRLPLLFSTSLFPCHSFTPIHLSQSKNYCNTRLSLFSFTSDLIVPAIRFNTLFSHSIISVLSSIIIHHRHFNSFTCFHHSLPLNFYVAHLSLSSSHTITFNFTLCYLPYQPSLDKLKTHPLFSDLPHTQSLGLANNNIANSHTTPFLTICTRFLQTSLLPLKIPFINIMSNRGDIPHLCLTSA